MTDPFVLNLAWIAGAALLGFTVAAVFAGWLRLPRPLYLVAYLALVGPFLYAFACWSQLAVGELLAHNWGWGLLGALLIGAFTVKNVLSQPSSARTRGLALAFDLAWSGLVYGMLDALFLSVLPVLAIGQAFAALGWTDSLPGQLLVGLIALLASLLVTAAYHLGYPEYRKKGGVIGPSIGNGVMSLAYILTANPLSAVISHIAMHIAGVLRGPSRVMQLPPHYEL